MLLEMTSIISVEAFPTTFKLIFDIIPILLIFWQVCVQIIPDHNSEKKTKIGARLAKLSPKQFKFSLSIYGMSVTG